MKSKSNTPLKIIKSELFRDCKLLQLFIWCVLKAKTEHDLPEMLGKGDVDTGQFITGRYVASKELKMTPSSYVRKLVRLKELGYVNTSILKGFTCITVNNYTSYVKSNTNGNKDQEHTLNLELLTNVSSCSGEHKQTVEKEPPEALRREVEKHDLRPIMTYFTTNYHEKFGKPYIVSWARDCACFKTLLENGLTFVTITKAINNYFSDNDAFVSKRGHSITLFKFNINKYVESTTERVDHLTLEIRE